MGGKKRKIKIKWKIPAKWTMFGLLMGVVLATVGSVGALNGWFGGGGSVPEDTMTRGLVGYWGFDEGSGTIAYDSSGYANNATTSGTAPSWTKGKVGGALEFDGTDDYVGVRNSDSLNITDAITLEAWVFDPPPEKQYADPAKKVTDPEVIKQLQQQGIDPDGVEIFQDYALSYDANGNKVKEKSPYAQFYKDLNSDKKFMMVSGLPMVNADGVPVEVGWIDNKDGSYTAKVNQFKATVAGDKVTLTVFNDQPDGKIKKDNVLIFQPQIWLAGKEQKPPSKIATLLAVDPLNPNYTANTLEWDYGIAKRRLRIIEGSILGSWVFPANPNGEVRIKYNQSGDYKLKLGQFRINEDEEIVTAQDFNQDTLGIPRQYPFTVADTATYYPDADTETTSVDGTAAVEDDGTFNTWALLIAFAGNNGFSGTQDSEASFPFFYTATANSDPTWIRIRRSPFLFDTSAFPDDGTITAATFSLYGTAKQDLLSITPDINVYASNPASNTAVVPTDVAPARWGSTAFSTVITYAAFNTAGYNDFILNASGIAAISKTGITKLGTRNANYDVAPSTPAWNVGVVVTSMSCYFSEQGEGFKPKLVVTYTSPSTTKVIVGKGQDAYQLQIDASLNVVGYINNQTVTTTVTKAWHHVALTYDGSTQKIYQDGVLKDQAALSGAISTNATNLKIGDFVPGKIDEVKIYSRALSAAEIRYHYNRGGPVAQWKMDEGEGRTVYDSTENNNDGTLVLAGSATSSAWVSGKYGSALSFDGTDDYVDAGNVYNGVKTVSFWLKADNLSQDITGLGNATTSVSSGTITTSGFTNPTIYVDGNRTSIIDTNWHHVVITTDTGINASEVNIGRGTSNYFGGILDDVRLYAYVRTPEEIRLDYNGGFAAHFGPKSDCNSDPGACMTQGLVGYWAMEEGSGLTAHDSSDYSNAGTLISGPSWAKGKVGSALSFDGTNDQVTATCSSCSFTRGVGLATIEYWIYTPSTLTGYGNLIGMRSGSTNINWQTFRNTGTQDFMVYNATDGMVDTGYNFPLDQWVHITNVIDGPNNQWRVYINGVWFSTAAINFGPAQSVFTMGCDNGAVNSCGKGNFDEVRIYNRALSASEIRYHYNRGGPVAQWKMDEGEGRTVYDSTDNNNDGTLVLAGSATSSAWVAGKYGSALSFDGTDDYVDIGDTSQTSVKTISFWLKANDTTSRKIIDIDGTDQIELDANSQITVTSFPGTVTYYLNGIANSRTITADTWYHVVITDTTGVNASNMDIGRVSTGYFDGLIDDVRIYNYARTPDEIRLDYNAGFAALFGPQTGCDQDPGSCMTQGLVGYWAMDEGRGTTIADISGNNNTGTFITVPPNGTGGAITNITESGVSYRVHTFTSSGTFTAPSVATNVQVLVVAGGGGGGYEIGGGGGAGGLTYNSSYAVTASQAITVTVGGGGAGAANNGVQGSSGNNSVFGSITTTGGGGGGSNNSQAASVTGKGVAGGSGGGGCGSAQITDRSGGAGTSGQGYAGGTGSNQGGGYGPAGGGGAGAVGADGTGSTNGNGGVGLAYTISGSSVYYAGGGGGAGYSGTPGSGGNGGGGAGGAGAGTAGTANTGGGGGGSHVATGGAGGSGIVIVRYTSGQGWTSGKVGSALSFNGVNDYVPAGNVYNGVKSAEFWVKTSSSTQQVLDLNGSAYIVLSSNAITATGWTSPTIYVNGVKTSTITANAWQHIVITTDTGINASAVNLGKVSSYFSGIMDEVKFYNRPLSDAEVRYHYNRGGPVAFWKFDEGEGRTAYDSTDNNNDGTLILAGSATSSAWVSGKYGSALSFDGVDDYVNVPDASKLNFGTGDFTVSVWAKTSQSAGAGYPVFISKDDEVAPETGWTLFQQANSNYLSWSVGSAGWKNVNSIYVINDGNWHYVVGVKTSTYVELFVDTVSVGSTVHSLGSTDNTISVKIASNGLANRWVQGLIDEVRIYNYARTPQQILLDYNQGLSAHFK